MKDSWLKTNISAAISYTWTIAAITILILVLTKEIKTDDKITYLIIGYVGNNVTQILSYYFGSAKALSDKLKSESDSKEDAQTTKTVVETTVTPKPDEEK